MSEPDWSEVERLFHLLADLGPDQRSALWQELSPDPSVRRHVEQLLEADASEDRLQSPVGGRSDLDLKAGDRLDQYTLIERIGEGGMGEVFLARQEFPVRRQVALKIVKLGMDTRRVLARFEAERQALAVMDHPHIARIYNAGTGPGGRPYLVMEHVSGQPLTAYADRHRLDLDRRLKLFLQACDAVQSAHQRGIIHRDLKPANLLVTEVDGAPFLKVIDFGIAKVIHQEGPGRTLFTSHGELIGTPEYMSPEQAALDPAQVDTTSDIYTLGVILFELLTGLLPFEFAERRAGGLLEILRTLREVEPPRPSARLASAGTTAAAAAALRGCTQAELRQELRNELDWIVLKALQPERPGRYPTASEFAADIRRYLQGDEVLARIPTVTYRLRKTLRRHRVAAAWVTLVILSLACGAVGTTLFALKAGQARRLAERSTYRATVQAAARALEESDAADAARLLDDSPLEFRGWEWRHLRSRLEEEGLAMAVPAGHGSVFLPGQMAVDENAGELRGLLHPDQSLAGWDLESGELLWERHLPDARQPTLTTDGRSVVFIDGTDALVREDAVDGGRRRILMLLQGPPPWSIREDPGMPGHVLVGTASGKSLVNLESGAVESADSGLLTARAGSRVLALKEGGPVLELEGEPGRLAPIGALALFSDMRLGRDGRALFGATWAGELLRWDGPEAAPTWRRGKAHKGAILDMALDEAGGRVATAGADHVVRIWNAQSGDLEHELHAHREQVMEVLFLDGGKRLASRSTTGLRVWNVPAQEVERQGVTVLRGHSQHVYPVAFTPDGTSLLSGGWDGRLVVWDTATGQPRRSVAFDHPDRTVVTAVAPSADGRRAYVGVSSRTAGSHIFAIDPLTGAGEPVAAGPEGYGSNALALDPGRPRLAILWSQYERGSILEVRDTGSGGVLRAFEPLRTRTVDPLAREFTRAVAYSADGRHLAMVLGDDRLMLVDAGSLETRRSIDLGDHRLSALAFSPDSRYLAAGRDDLALVVYRVEDGAQVAAMAGHTATIFSVAWSPDGSRLASGADDRTVRLWDATGWDQMVELRGHDSYVYSVAFRPDGRCLASGSGDGTVRLWDTRPGEERRRARWSGGRSSPGASPPWETRVSLPVLPRP